MCHAAEMRTKAKPRGLGRGPSGTIRAKSAHISTNTRSKIRAKHPLWTKARLGIRANEVLVLSDFIWDRFLSPTTEARGYKGISYRLGEAIVPADVRRGRWELKGVDPESYYWQIAQPMPAVLNGARCGEALSCSESEPPLPCLSCSIFGHWRLLSRLAATVLDTFRRKTAAQKHPFVALWWREEGGKKEKD
ncbi:hypothetical protein GGX14DRAFT_401171 [Mycena pura]|uniref:Uncharacterized protein n=1 Tax=Mycena pura TaxID=153505 RepID=A0AAD6V5A0_9AGAR|nr:hypothetical protein GGX14DRAFT_401171 [Mycena pura]